MKSLGEALRMFQDPDVRDRHVSIVEEAHCIESANLVSEFADMAGRSIARSLKRAGAPVGIVMEICDDEKFGEEIGAIILGSLKIGIAVGIEMEKAE